MASLSTTLHDQSIYCIDFRLPRKGDIYLHTVGMHGKSVNMVSVATYNHSHRRQQRHIIGHISHLGLQS